MQYISLQNLTHDLCRSDLNRGEVDLLQLKLNELNDWSGFVTNLELHGVAPLALINIQKYELVLTSNLLIQFTALRLRHKAIANARHKTLKDIQSAFASQSIPLIALKGLALSQLIYSSSAMRPMRDIDILIPVEQLDSAANALRSLGFNLPQHQKSKYMRGVHQLPDASLTVDGFNISIEIHHNTMPRDVFDSLTYDDVKCQLQQFEWRGIPLLALDHTLMLHHLCRHLQSQHPNDTIKLINVVDIIRYVDKYIDVIDWPQLNNKYPHIINTLRCVHFIIPLTISVQKKIPQMSDKPPRGVGQCMPALSRIFISSRTLKSSLRLLFFPPPWWLHLHYSVIPNTTLFWVILFRHPTRVIRMFGLRLVSRLRGG